MTDSTINKNDDVDIVIELDRLLDDVRQCIEKCRKHHHIPGISKLERKFRAEDRFLKRVSIHVLYCLYYLIQQSLFVFI